MRAAAPSKLAHPSADDATQAQRYRQLLTLATPSSFRGPLYGAILANVIQWAADEQDAADGLDNGARWQAAPETRPIAQSGLSYRVVSELERLGMIYLGDLTGCTALALYERGGIGPTTVLQIQDVLHRHGLELASKQ